MTLTIPWEEEWVEVSAVFFMVLGFIISIMSHNTFLSYLSIIISGLTAGRIYYQKRFDKPIFPIILMVVGFLIGYLLGALWTSRFWTLVAFLVSFWLSYYLHLKKIITIFKSDNFFR